MDTALMGRQAATRPVMTARTQRCDDATWERAARKAARSPERTIGEALRRFTRAYAQLPNTGSLPRLSPPPGMGPHGYRTIDEDYHAAMDKAGARGEILAEEMRRFLTSYGAGSLPLHRYMSMTYGARA